MSNAKYAEELRFIQTAIRETYGLTEEQARRAMELASIEDFFKRDYEMAAHDPVEQWAEFAYKVYQSHQPHRPQAYVVGKRKPGTKEPVLSRARLERIKASARKLMGNKKPTKKEK